MPIRKEERQVNVFSYEGGLKSRNRVVTLNYILVIYAALAPRGRFEDKIQILTQMEFYRAKYYNLITIIQPR